MKRLLIIVAIALALGCCIVSAAPKGELSYGAQTRLEVTYDKFLNVYYIGPSLAMVGGTTDRPRVTLEMQRTPKGKIMFMNVMMTSKDFAYLDRGIFIVNGRRYDTPALDPFGDFCFHDVFNGYIIESLYFLFSDPAVAAIVDAIRNAGVSGVVEYRFYGEKRSFSGIMSEGEKQVWLDMLEYYDFYDVPVL